MFQEITSKTTAYEQLATEEQQKMTWLEKTLGFKPGITNLASEANKDLYPVDEWLTEKVITIPKTKYIFQAIFGLGITALFYFMQRDKLLPFRTTSYALFLYATLVLLVVNVVRTLIFALTTEQKIVLSSYAIQLDQRTYPWNEIIDVCLTKKAGNKQPYHLTLLMKNGPTVRYSLAHFQSPFDNTLSRICTYVLHFQEKANRV
ncbi:hypothetical protein MKQ68_24175 [Chitinophaga horti]|uniref:Signal peptidase complex subunit 2 n=1 Tax=Chitinophaga horti TaxID=2920382 RepID=A0ABY6J0I5_9BACT|nr:hypothetical protein [Chitinophaga horti]UYQ93184.1 hypothetical protein MKQ68_24175 [Chitinophaga horti]